MRISSEPFQWLGWAIASKDDEPICLHLGGNLIRYMPADVILYGRSYQQRAGACYHEVEVTGWSRATA
jgi:hypothetical protein